ncbi:LysR family transcriptional regulator [Arthrobacter sp. Marseille-P9274]|uniref:LysR family transcriptional regulator n=1 Tax=Arthrobacter sp. Marseille-P9274 TaxID=2866572 RepID=UPI0021CA7277|nr:LysR family transcriptional regulator [Arthrobacter sp. Marseille-P9274]
MDVEVRHLRAFVAVADEESFTYAASVLHLTQPALTRTIQQLEATLGVKLVARTSRTFELTEPGREFYNRARRLLSDLDRAVQAVRGNTVFRLGFTWLLPSPWAQQTAARFTEASGMKVIFVRCDHPPAALRRGEVEAVVVRSGQPGWDLDGVDLFEEPRVLVCSRHSPLADRQSVAWDEVPRWPLVINTANGTTQPSLWPEATLTVLETSSYDEWLESVASGAGVGVIPEIGARHTHPELHFVPLKDAPPVIVRLVMAPHVPRSVRRDFLHATQQE